MNTAGPIGFWSPQRYGRPDNPLITVGSLDKDGQYSSANSVEGPSPDGVDPLLTGSLSLYAVGQDIEVPKIGTFDAGQYERASGSSFAAPQVAGLAGYISTSPAFGGAQPGPGSIAMARKSQMLALKRRNKAYDALGAAYNGVREIKCEQTTPARRDLKKAHYSKKIVPMLQPQNDSPIPRSVVIERQLVSAIDSLALPHKIVGPQPLGRPHIPSTHPNMPQVVTAKFRTTRSSNLDFPKPEGPKGAPLPGGKPTIQPPPPPPAAPTSATGGGGPKGAPLPGGKPTIQRPPPPPAATTPATGGGGAPPAPTVSPQAATPTRSGQSPTQSSARIAPPTHSPTVSVDNNPKDVSSLSRSMAKAHSLANNRTYLSSGQPSFSASWLVHWLELSTAADFDDAN